MAKPTPKPHSTTRRRTPSIEAHPDTPASAEVDTMTVPELRALIAVAEAKIKEKTELDRRMLIEDTERRASDLGLSIQDLFGTANPVKPARAKAASGGSAATLPVRFKGPSGEEWSGRGRMPRWLIALEAEGRKKEDFAV